MKPLWRSIWKEVLALAPILVACCLAAGAAPVWRAFRLEPVALIAYVFGCAALGAHVMGHEYSHRTLASLLVQPIRRTTILAIKLAVLAGALLALTAIASVGPDSPILRFPARAALHSGVVYLPALMGLTLAPYLALLARSTLGGAVFTIAVPGVLLVAGDLLGLAVYGLARPGEIDRFKYTLFPIGTVAACVFAAIAVWRRFARLEVIDGGGGRVSLPAVYAPAPVSTGRQKRSPLWLLVTKELRLQQMAFIVGGLYVVSALALWSFERPRQLAPAVPWPALNILYGSLVSMLIGALASAEERQLGTLAWQSLMPLSRRTQFAVKTAVVFGLALACAAALPAALAFIVAVPYRAAVPEGFFFWMCLLAAVCAMGGLYVSTVSSSGVKALAAALPVLASCFVLLQGAYLAVGWAAWHNWIDRRSLPVFPLTEARARSIAAGLTCWLAIVVLTLAHRNHWAAGRTIGGIAAQAAAIAAAIAVGGVAMFVLGFR